VTVAIPILEKALGIESIALEPVSESSENILRNFSLGSGSLLSSIDSLSPNIIKLSVNSLFEVLLGEYFINGIAEFFPANMATFLRCFETSDDLLKLGG